MSSPFDSSNHVPVEFIDRHFRPSVGAYNEFPFLAIEPEKDKITRLAVEAVAYEAGRVMHPQRALWLVDFEAELTGAPYAEYMDQCDSTSQFLGWARRRAFVNEWASSGKLAAEQYDDGERAIEPKKGWGAVAGGNDFNGWD